MWAHLQSSLDIEREVDSYARICMCLCVRAEESGLIK